MGHERAFLADIIEHPNSDVPRLIYADWLDDAGDEPRAEFIRLQCRIAALPAHDPEKTLLDERQQALLNEYARRWAAPLNGMVDEWAFHRGFIECIEVKQRHHAAFRACMNDVFANFPIRAVRLVGEPDVALALLDRPDYLARLYSLDLKDLATAHPEAFMDRLLQPQSAGLRTLLIESEQSSEEWDRQLHRLGGPGPLQALTELGLAFGTVETPPSSRVLGAIATSPHLSNLVKFHIPFSEFGLPLARQLADSCTLTRLTHLDLGCAEISDPGWRRLAAGPNIARLHWLGLFGANIVRGDETFNLKDHELGQRFRDLLGPGADFLTSDTFPRWSGQRWT